MVYQLVEDALRVVVLAQSEEGAPHQLLEVVGIVLLGPQHPLHSLLAVAVVGVQVHHVEHVVLILVGGHVLKAFAQILVGAVYHILGQPYLCPAVDVLRQLLVNHLRQVVLGSLIVGFAQGVVNLVVEGNDRVGLQFDGPVQRLLSLVEAPLRLVVVGNVGQVVGIHKDGFPRLDRLLILLKRLLEFLVVEIFLVAQLLSPTVLLNIRCS